MQKGKSSISWREKLEKKIQPKLVDLSLNWSKKMGTGKMLIPTPLLIDSTIKKIPQGKIDSKLLLGAAIFGVGWGMTGLCPAPAVARIGIAPFEAATWVFVFFMFAGFKLETLLRKN